MDKRTKEYRESRRAPLPVPKIYFVEDLAYNRYRVGRTDYPGDVFELVSVADFQAFKRVYEQLGFKLKDVTWED